MIAIGSDHGGFDLKEAVIAHLKEKGYEIVPVSQLIYTDNYHIDSEGKQIKNEQ